MTLPLEQLRDQSETALDEYIRDNVLRINDLGFKTLWSCSGLIAEHKPLVHMIETEAGAMIGLEPAKINKIWVTAYLCFEPNADLPLIHGWKREYVKLLDGPATNYKIDDNFPEYNDYEEIDLNVKKMWDRLFDFLNEALEV